MVETGEGFNKHIDALVAIFVSTGSEKVEGIVEIKVIMTVEMATDEIVDDILFDGMQILKFVHGTEFDDIETVG